MAKNQKGFSHIILPLLLVVAIAAVGFFVVSKKKSHDEAVQVSKIDLAHPDEFIQADFIDLSKVYSISKFRSVIGHDFSGNGETCRSMKHYFDPQGDTSQAKDANGMPPKPDGKTDTNIFSPVDGVIKEVASERTPIGEQVYIVPDNAQAYTIRLFHIYLDSGVKRGTKVKAGQKIGVIGKDQGTDISVEAGYNTGKFISYFSVMPDTVFAHYIARGAKSRDDFIISKAYRDAHPVPCDQGIKSDQQFRYPEGYDQSQDVVHLSGYVEPDYKQAPKDQQKDEANIPKEYGNDIPAQ